MSSLGATQVISFNYRTICDEDCQSVAILSAMNCAKAHRLNCIDNFLPEPSVHGRMIGTPMRNERVLDAKGEINRQGQRDNVTRGPLVASKVGGAY
jgi:hypothetical protein